MTHRFRYTNPNSPAAKQRKASYNTAAYRAAGQAGTAQVKAGTARCWRCHRPIPPSARRGPDWQLGHDDHNRAIIRGPEHTRCNQRTAAIAGNRKQRAIRTPMPRRRITPLSL